jgi:phenylalanyl-tRNA synthetase beta chain
LSYQKCDQVLGLTIEPNAIDEVLTRFGLKKAQPTRPPQTRQLKAVKSNELISVWEIPSYRRDLQRDVDLVEEVLRAYGVDKIAGSNRSRFTPSTAADRAATVESSLRECLIHHGVSEVRTSKLIPRSAMSAEAAIKLRNPLSEDHVALRPSLLPGLLLVLDRNLRASADRVAIFEMGRIFVPPEAGEERRLGILLWGNVTSTPHWRAVEKRKLDFLDLRGTIESLAIPDLSFRRQPEARGEKSEAWQIDFATATQVFSGTEYLGRAGQLSTTQTSEIDASGAIFFAEIAVEPIESLAQRTKTFHEIERFPAVTRDIAMIVPDRLTHAQIIDVIRSGQEPLLESVELFDLFTSGLGTAQKSLAYRLTYRDRSRTLTNEEVTAAHAKIRKRLQDELGAELRE